MIDPVVDLDWVRAHEARTVLADVRFYLDGRSGRAAYERGHLPGAIFVDLEADLAAPASAADGRHPLPDPGAFAERMATLGVGDGDVVIAYDDAGGVMAARLVWMLRATGHDAALLDGGLDAYAGELATAEPHRPRASLHRPAVAGRPAWPTPWPTAAVAGPTSVVLDARQPERFRGESEPIDPRAGHIPGARSVPCRDNVDDNGRFLPPGALRERFAAAGVDRRAPTWCPTAARA